MCESRITTIAKCLRFKSRSNTKMAGNNVKQFWLRLPRGKPRERTRSKFGENLTIRVAFCLLASRWNAHTVLDELKSSAQLIINLMSEADASAYLNSLSIFISLSLFSRFYCPFDFYRTRLKQTPQLDAGEETRRRLVENSQETCRRPKSVQFELKIFRVPNFRKIIMADLISSKLIR